MHIVLRSQTVLHTSQQKRTSSSLFCSSPRGFPFARAVTSSSSSSFSCCLFPYVSIICLSYFSPWFSNLRFPPLARNWRKWGISSPASPSSHPNSCLFLFSQEPHFLLLNQYSVFALWEPGKYCSQPSQRVNSESIFFLMKCLGFSDVNHGPIWSSICWLHFLGPVSLNSYCCYESPVYFRYTHACWCLSPYIFFLSRDISPGHLHPAAPEWAGRSAGPHCNGTWSFLSAFSFAESLLLGFAPVCRWSTRSCSFLREGMQWEGHEYNECFVCITHKRKWRGRSVLSPVRFPVKQVLRRSFETSNLFSTLWICLFWTCGPLQLASLKYILIFIFIYLFVS